jgi:hypothetical protein
MSAFGGKADIERTLKTGAVLPATAAAVLWTSALYGHQLETVIGAEPTRLWYHTAVSHDRSTVATASGGQGTAVQIGSILRRIE